jgi:septum formation protein
MGHNACQINGELPLSDTAIPQLYLASASPRRRELLTQIGLHFVVVPQQVDESVQPNEAPADYVLRIANAKARAALLDSGRQQPAPVLSADTSVVLGSTIFGKPTSLREAKHMLSSLAGQTHQVLTAVVLYQDQQCLSSVVSTDVSFRAISDAEIDAYWQSGEPKDKAGAYAIQGRGALFVEKINGSYSNVVGLPLFETAQLLSQFGISSTTLLAGMLSGVSA